MNILAQIQDILVDINCHSLYGYPLNFEKISKTLKFLETEFKKESHFKHKRLFTFLSNKIHSSFQSTTITDSEIGQLKNIFILLSNSYNPTSNTIITNNNSEVESNKLTENDYCIELIRICEYLKIYVNKTKETVDYITTLNVTDIDFAKSDERIEYYSHYYYLLIDDYKEIIYSYSQIPVELLADSIQLYRKKIETLITEIDTINKIIFRKKEELDTKFGRLNYVDDDDFDDDDSNVVDGEAEFWREWYHGDIERLGF